MPCPWLMTVDLVQQGDTMGQRQREEVREGGRRETTKKKGRGPWRTHPLTRTPPKSRDVDTSTRAPRRERGRGEKRKKERKTRDVANDARTPWLGHQPSQGTWTPAHAPQGEREGGRKKERKTRDVADDARTPWLGHHPSQGTWTPAHAPQRQGRGKEKDSESDKKVPKVNKNGKPEIIGNYRHQRPYNHKSLTI